MAREEPWRDGDVAKEGLRCWRVLVKGGAVTRDGPLRGRGRVKQE